MSNWFPLHCHSHYSLLDGLSQPKHIVSRLKECGYEGSALTDHGSLGGSIGFGDALQKNKLKPILGCEFYISNRDATDKSLDNKNAHLCVLAKNEQGWKNLMKASSASYQPQYFYRKPRLDLERLGQFAKGEWIAFSGHMGSDLADACFEEPKLAYRAKTYEDARVLVRKDWKDSVEMMIARYQKAFGKANFYLEIQIVDQENLPASLVVAKILRHIGKKLDVPRVATADSHYARRSDAADQRIILCSALGTTLGQVERQIEQGEDVALGAFFLSNNYHIPSPEEIGQLHADHPDELKNSLEIASRCDVYKIGGKPMFPAFKCPGGETPDAYLKSMCENGWKKLVDGKVPKEKHDIYRSRLFDKELPIITGAGLSSYFLIVQDYIRHAVEDLKAMVGRGRGSSAGCLVSYLTGITRVDPIKAGLIFERFYNAGRNSPGHIAFPDIDTDFPISMREEVIQYLRDTYGEDKVAQMATFARMQGRGAIKDVLRARGSVSFEEMNLITENIPDEAEIIDQLQLMRDESETGEASIIEWTLINNPDGLKNWVTREPDGELNGTLASEFGQAIRLEGTKRSVGKHASGVIISSEDLSQLVPMIYDKSSNQMLVGVDMREAEKMGLIKCDILGLRTLDSLLGAFNFVRTGRL